MARKLDIHVVPNDTRFRWRVTHAGLTLSAHRTQRRAVVAGVRLARRNRLDVVTHARNGRIRSKDSYENETAVHDQER
jgi:Uncharacterized protein conserved in bacteria (DUF2188)